MTPLFYNEITKHKEYISSYFKQNPRAYLLLCYPTRLPHLFAHIYGHGHDPKGVLIWTLTAEYGAGSIPSRGKFFG